MLTSATRLLCHQVFTLEQRKLQLKTAMTERIEEIKIHKELLQRQLREAETDKTNVSRELNERAVRIDQLKKRYEIIIMSMDSTDDGKPKTHAYYVVKHAQEREELQRKGDALDTKIRKREKEVRALENTLRLMDSRNGKLKQSFRKIDDSNSEVQRKQKLEVQYRTALDRCKHKRRELRELQEELQALQEALAAVEREEATARKQLDAAEAAAALADRELAEQQVARGGGCQCDVLVNTSISTFFLLLQPHALFSPRPLRRRLSERCGRFNSWCTGIGKAPAFRASRTRRKRGTLSIASCGTLTGVSCRTLMP